MINQSQTSSPTAIKRSILVKSDFQTEHFRIAINNNKVNQTNALLSIYVYFMIVPTQAVLIAVKKKSGKKKNANTKEHQRFVMYWQRRSSSSIHYWLSFGELWHSYSWPWIHLVKHSYNVNKARIPFISFRTERHKGDSKVKLKLRISPSLSHSFSLAHP